MYINKEEREVLYRRKPTTARSENDRTRSPPFSHYRHRTHSHWWKQGIQWGFCHAEVWKFLSHPIHRFPKTIGWFLDFSTNYWQIGNRWVLSGSLFSSCWANLFWYCKPKVPSTCHGSTRPPERPSRGKADFHLLIICNLLIKTMNLGGVCNCENWSTY